MRLRRLWKDESGQTLVMAVLSMTLLLGFLALAVDVGVLFHARRNVQLAADGAAVAGALDYKYNTSQSRAYAAARAAAQANGISNVATNVQPHLPPVNGLYAGTSNDIEVIVSQPVNTTLLNFFGVPSVNISGRAVASSGPTDGCIWALKTGGGGITLTGGAINATNCNIYDNSAWTETGGSVSAKKIGIVGAYTDTGGSITPNPPSTGITAVANPLNLTMPTPQTGACPAACTQNVTGRSQTLSQGRYTSVSETSGNLTFSPGNYTITGVLSITGGNVTFGAGVYIIEGGLTITGSGSTVANGVTFYVSGGSGTTITGGSAMTITAPTNGLALVEEDSKGVTITGGGGMTFDGIVYAPTSHLTLTGSGATFSTDLIVGSIGMTGGTFTSTNYAVVANQNSVLGKLGLVE
jgi:hypothetical protein